jgi:predicted CxxxxCH...CXXCH cytochrome family protein
MRLLPPTQTNLPYTNTANEPNKYSIRYLGDAEISAGFIDVILADLVASPIVVAVPATAPAGQYYGNLTVTNTSTGLTSVNYVITITVNGVLTPSVIYGKTTVAANSSFTYSVLSAPNATYNWTLPSGWDFDGASNANRIKVITGAVGNNGNITVNLANACGTGPTESLAVTVNTTTDHSLYNCTSCHITHNAPGSTLTAVAGNALLCQSCHTSTGAASAKPLVNADKGTSSHAWDVLAQNDTKEVLPPLDSSMQLRIVDNKIICSTCHNQHENSAGSPYLRIDNTDDLLCKDCHRTRDKGLYSTDNTNNRGSHPVGVTYDDTDPRFKNTQTLVTNGNKVQCSSCHGVHDVTGSLGLAANGNLLRTTNNVSLCTDCHNYGTHNGMSCLDCHEVHNSLDGTVDDNIYMIKRTVSTPVSGDKNVIFTARSGNNSFADGLGIELPGNEKFDGICEVCHDPGYDDSPLDHFLNNGSGTDQYHDSQGGQAGANCTSCHPHSSNFSPSGGDCVTCHQDNFPTWNVSDGHVAHTTKYDFDCSTCHFQRGSGTAFHENGTPDVNFDPDGLARRNGLDTNTPVFNGDSTCDNIYCHSDGQTSRRSSDANYTWSGFVPISINSSYLTTPNWDAGSITDCNLCHPGPTSGGVSGPIIGTMDSPYLIYSTETTETTRPDTGTHNSGNHHDNDKGLSGTDWVNVQCFWCHKADHQFDDVSGTTDNNAQYQGTYGIGYDGTGTIVHVDGETQFDPRQYSNGGTFPDNNTYAADATAPHCGNPKSCW